MKPEIAIIVAKAKDNGIGCSDGLPWHMPAELQYFKARTVGKPVIMGRNTFLSLGDGIVGKPLKNRTNIVLTRGCFSQSGIIVKHSIEDAIDFALQEAQSCGENEIMIIGGEEIFKQSIKYADVVYLTQIQYEKFEKTNAWLPANFLDGWEPTDKKIQIMHENQLDIDLECSLETWRRVS